MRIEKYTDRLKALVQSAQIHALSSGHQQITPLHVLKALLDDEDRLAANTIIVLTSNLGAEYLAALPEGEPAEAARAQVMEVVRRSFRPEFLNRLDEIILFNRLGRNEMKRIVDIQLKYLQKLLNDRKIVLDVNEKAKTWLANTGYDPVYGARPLKRVIQRQLQNPLAKMLLSDVIADGETVRVTVKDGQLAINGSEFAQAA
jgi:ATP-dependent Clp protease ATP-binding subunit ClpB